MTKRDNIVWREWGDDAFEEARRENKPIFLAIGFSACRWCARQWREIRNSPALTALLAERFVCVSVDRDLRPDIDAAYFAAQSAEKDAPGWPLTALLTDGKLPFFLTGYLPAEELLETLRDALADWERSREKIDALARANVETARARMRAVQSDGATGAEIYPVFRQRLEERFDARFGGFGQPPKFPAPQCTKLLIRYGVIGEDARALQMGLETLRAQCEGAIFDHVGGGVMRYALDSAWLVPEREKMLCDNALFADACVEAWLATREAMFLVAVERTLAWMLREMRAPGGAFCAAQWEPDGTETFELSRADLLRFLGETDGEAFCIYYGIAEKSLPSRHGHEGIETPRMLALCERLWRRRREQGALARDEKLLAVPNALAVQALCRAWDATGRDVYREAAVAAGAFLRENMTLSDGTIAVCRGETHGFLDDTAQTANAALALYQSTLDSAWLDWAVSLARRMLARFTARQEAGFRLAPGGAEKLFVRPVETYDGATPSGNAAALETLAALAKLDVGGGWSDAAQTQLAFVSGGLAEAPQERAATLLAAMPLLYRTRLLECRASAAENEALLAALHGRYLPLLFRKCAQPGPFGSRWIFSDAASPRRPVYEMERLLREL